MDGGTWRRLKIAFELSAGHGFPRLSEGEKNLLFGLLLAIEAGHGAKAVADVAVQGSWARRSTDDNRPLEARILDLARRVDVRAFL